jgi:DNA-binding NarL/FixJ family response regulator
VAENRLLREAIAKLLTRKGDIRFVGASSFSPEVQHQVRTSQADILMLDSVPIPIWNNGFIREITRSVAGLKLIMTGMEPDEEMFLRAIRAGAVGYVLKDAPAADMEAAVRAASRNEASCPPRLCLSLFKYIAQQTLRPEVHAAETSLSRREQQLVPLIAHGLTNKEIGVQLNICEQTVKNHVHHMLHKLGANDRVSVVRVWRAQSYSTQISRFDI